MQWHRIRQSRNVIKYFGAQLEDIAMDQSCHFKVHSMRLILEMSCKEKDEENELLTQSSVTIKKLPNVYKSCPIMISTEK